MITYAITHRTRYVYDADVATSFGRAHLLPREQGDQRSSDAEVVLDPAPTSCASTSTPSATAPRTSWSAARTASSRCSRAAP